MKIGQGKCRSIVRDAAYPEESAKQILEGSQPCTIRKIGSSGLR